MEIEVYVGAFESERQNLELKKTSNNKKVLGCEM